MTAAVAAQRSAPTRVAIAGFGTVGRSVARLLHEVAPPELQLVAILKPAGEGTLRPAKCFTAAE